MPQIIRLAKLIISSVILRIYLEMSTMGFNILMATLKLKTEEEVQVEVNGFKKMHMGTCNARITIT